MSATYSEIYQRARENAQAILTDRKGYFTARDEITIDAILRSFAWELVLLGVVKPDEVSSVKEG